MGILQIQIETWQFVIGLLGIAFGVGIGWGKLLSKIGTLETKVETISKNLKTVIDFLIKEESLDPSLIISRSPLEATEKGLEILKETQFLEIFNSQGEKLLNAILIENPKTKFDVEKAAIRIAVSFLDADFMTPVKTYLYNHPQLNSETFAALAGIYLRDRYLEKHPEITQ